MQSELQGAVSGFESLTAENLAGIQIVDAEI